MSLHYTAYGLRICSNADIPGLLPEPGRGAADVRVELRAATRNETLAEPSGPAWHSSPERDETGRPQVRIWKLPGTGYSFLYDDGTRVEVSETADHIVAWSPPELGFADTAYYVAGPALGFVLRLRNRTVLHASAVAWNQCAVLFTGTSGAGKSTMAAAMTRFGCPLVTEDLSSVVERQGQFTVSRGYPRVNLWPESVAALFGSPEALPEVAPPWEKRYLAMDPDEFRKLQDPAPIQAIYFLARREDAGEGPQVSEMKPSEATLALIGNTYMNHLPGQKQQANEFDALSSLAGRVPVRRLTAAEGQIDEQCLAVLNDLGAPEPSTEPMPAVARV